MFDRKNKQYDDNHAKPHEHKRCSCLTKKNNENFCPKKWYKDCDYEWKCYKYKKFFCYLEKIFGRDYDYELKCCGYCKKHDEYKKR